MKHSIALAALVVTTMGLSALPSVAQDQTTPTAQKSDRETHRTLRDNGPGRGGPMGGPTMAARGMGGGTLLGLACTPNGAEALEIAFVRLSHRVELTAEQQPLFDAYRTKALTSQTTFADECAKVMPDEASTTAPDMITRVKSAIALEQARLTAMNAVLPDLEAFYGSLTDEQKANLIPPRMSNRDDAPGRGNGDDRNAPGRTLRAPAPGR